MVDIDSMGPGLPLLGGQFSNFLPGKVSLEFKLHGMSIFRNIQMATYFGTGWCYSHMVGYAGSPTYTAYADMTLTWSKVKVTGLLNFRQLAKPCMLAAMTAAPLRGFLVYNIVHVMQSVVRFICSSWSLFPLCHLGLGLRLEPPVDWLIKVLCPTRH